MLLPIATDSIVIDELKSLLSKNLDKRFPITALNICGFLLDPSQLKIDINRYLSNKRQQKKKLLLDMLNTFKIDQISPTNSTQFMHPSSTFSCSGISTGISGSMKRNLSIDCVSEPTRNMKKLRENLLQKHTPLPTTSDDPIKIEIENYLKLDVVCDDVLEFWKEIH